MAAPGSQLRHVKGRLILNPTSADTPGGDSAYGGKILGTYQSFRLRKIPLRESLRAEEYGGERVDSMHLGFDIEATAVLRNWDADALANRFPNSAVAGVGGSVRQVFEAGTALIPGQWMTDFSAALMWAPFDVAHTGLYIFNSVPFYREAFEERLGAFEDLALEDVRWLCLRSGSTKKYRMASMTDIQAAAFP